MRRLTLFMLALAAARSRAAKLFPPALDRLPAGAIMPEGWLLNQAHIQAAGLTGGAAAWPGVGISTGRYLATGGGNTGEEQGGEYFINGMYPLTCQIDIPGAFATRTRGTYRPQGVTCVTVAMVCSRSGSVAVRQ